MYRYADQTDLKFHEALKYCETGQLDKLKKLLDSLRNDEKKEILFRKSYQHPQIKLYALHRPSFCIDVAVFFEHLDVINYLYSVMKELDKDRDEKYPFLNDKTDMFIKATARIAIVNKKMKSMQFFIDLKNNNSFEVTFDIFELIVDDSYIEVYEHLVDCGFLSNAESECLDHLFYAACISGCWKILKLLFEKMRNFIDKQMQEKNIILSSITSAIKFNNTQILNIFINNNVHTLTNCRNKLIFYLHEGSTVEMFKYLLSRKEFSGIEKIETIELLGAFKVAYGGEHYSKALECWEDAFNKRNLKEEYKEKSVLEPMVAFEYTSEIKTQEEFIKLKENANNENVLMQAMLIIERVFGPGSDFVTKNLDSRAHAYAKSHDYHKAFTYWMYLFDNLIRSKLPFCEDTTTKMFYNFMKCFYQSHQAIKNKTLKAQYASEERISSIKRTVIDVTQIFKQQLEGLKQSIFPYFTNSEDSSFLIYYIGILSIIMAEGDYWDDEEKLKLKKIMSEILNFDLDKLLKGYSFLKFALEIDAYKGLATKIGVKKTYFNEEYFYKYITLLLECKYNPNNYSGGESSFHFVVSLIIDLECRSLMTKESFNEEKSTYRIIEKFLAYGTHADIQNKNGLTANDILEENHIYDTSLMQASINLKCLASRKIVEYGLKYENLVPLNTYRTIRMHQIEKTSLYHVDEYDADDYYGDDL